MSRKLILPIIAVIGAGIAVCVAVWSQKTISPSPVIFPAPKSPYAASVYGAGIIEASSENIAVGSPFILPVTEIFVTEGDFVKRGDRLFSLDTRSFLAQKEIDLCKLRLAEIAYEDAKVQFSFYTRLQDRNAVSEKDYQAAYYAMKEAEEQVAIAKASLLQTETDIERATVCASCEGRVLQVNIHPGEIYPQNSYTVTQSYVNLPTSLILLGSVHPLQMRIDIDEEDSWRYRSGAKATAFVRGNASISFPMEFVRVEPYILPKVSFTGNNIQRIDTRVLQVLYRFDKGNLPVYPGQLLDVYLEVPEEES